MTVKNALLIIKVLNLDPDQYVIMGESALAAHGLLSWDRVDELTMLANGEAWETLCRYGLDYDGPVSGDHGMILFEDLGKVYQRWVGSFRGKNRGRELITRGSVIDGLNYGNPVDILRIYLELNAGKYSNVIDPIVARINSDIIERKSASKLFVEITKLFSEFQISIPHISSCI